MLQSTERSATMNNPQVIAESLHFIEEGRFARDITWSDAVLGTIEKACEGTECEGAAKWIKEEADR